MQKGRYRAVIFARAQAPRVAHGIISPGVNVCLPPIHIG